MPNFHKRLLVMMLVLCYNQIFWRQTYINKKTSKISDIRYKQYKGQKDKQIKAINGYFIINTPTKRNR